MRIKSRGSFTKTRKFLSDLMEINPKFRDVMEKHAEEGVRALMIATPRDTGNTASKWYWKIQPWGLEFLNSNRVGNTSVAVLLQFGHGTKNGSYIQGVDYINPALKPIFDKIAQDIVEEVRKI